MDKEGSTSSDHAENKNKNDPETGRSEGGDLYERYTTAISQIESEPRDAVSTLLQIQEHVAMQSYFSISSSSSETIDDISTFILPYLTVDHHLALAHTQLPMDQHQIATRRTNLLKACDYFNAFLQKLEAYDVLTKEETAQYQMLVEMTDHMNSRHGHNDANPTTPSLLPPPMSRDMKIAQFRQKQQLQQEQERLKSLQMRRRRLQSTISDDDIIDGYDHESLFRTSTLSSIHIAKMITIEEWSAILQELPMITMMIMSQLQEQPSGSDDRYRTTTSSHGSSAPVVPPDPRQLPPGQRPPMELTQITKDATTGQLRIHRQEIQNQMFRPGWMQPTMSLEELAEREVTAAVQRQEQQDQSERDRKSQPRRYQQLVQDGLEDDADLVEASVTYDREWDTFCDDNPRGSGNKRGDVGDRNF